MSQSESIIVIFQHKHAPYQSRIVLIFLGHAQGHVLFLQALRTPPEEKSNTPLVMPVRFFGVFFLPFGKINDLNHVGEEAGKRLLVKET